MIPRPAFDPAAFYQSAAREAFASAARAEAALTRISGLLGERRWWNDNVWAAEQIANDALAARAENSQPTPASRPDRGEDTPAREGAGS